MAEINEQTFEMLLERLQSIDKRFDKVDKDNDDIIKSIVAHVKDDKLVHDVVTKHSTYWSLALWICGGVILAAISAVARGWIK